MSTAVQNTIRDRFVDAQDAVCKECEIANRLAAPRISKVVLNMGVGRAIQDGQILNVVADHLTVIAGQRVAITKARKSIAQFRSRQGMKIGCMATLRGQRMWSFLDKLVYLAIPRIKDFRGLAPRRGFDKQGNYSLGLNEQALFPEVDLERLEHNQGLNVSIVIDNSDPSKSLSLLKGMGFPFRER